MVTFNESSTVSDAWPVKLTPDPFTALAPVVPDVPVEWSMSVNVPVPDFAAQVTYSSIVALVPSYFLYSSLRLVMRFSTRFVVVKFELL